MLLDGVARQRARFRHQRDLSGGKQQAAGGDGVRIRADGSGRTRGRNDLFHEDHSLYHVFSSILPFSRIRNNVLRFRENTGTIVLF